jgi:EmrB/QacA subfamily drug resistance transporter
VTRPATRVPAPDAAPPAGPTLRRIAAVVVLGTFLAQLDSTVVAVAIDTLHRAFDSPLSTVQWAMTGYLLALAAVIPLVGWSVRRFGTRRMWLLALTVFLGGSVLCGLAWSAGSLIAFRVLQGLGGGLIVPLAQVIIARAAGAARLGRLMGLIGMGVMLGPVLGPALGGLIISQVGWRGIFLINIPGCLIALVLSRQVLPDDGPGEPARLDVLGLCLLSPAIAGTIYGLSGVDGAGGVSAPRVLVPLVAGLILLVAFVVHAVRRPAEPIVDLRLLRIRSFGASSGAVFLFGACTVGASLLLPLYFQQARGSGALHTGLVLAPQGLAVAFAMLVAGRFTDRVGPRRVALTGLLLTSAGLAVFGTAGVATSAPLLSAALLVMGAGVGAALVPINAASLRGLPQSQIPRATTASRIFMQLGGAFGAAAAAVLLHHYTSGHHYTSAEPDRLAGAFALTFRWGLVLTALIVPLVLLLPGSPPEPVTPSGRRSRRSRRVQREPLEQL